jgi:hypothetical protein
MAFGSVAAKVEQAIYFRFILSEINLAAVGELNAHKATTVNPLCDDDLLVPAQRPPVGTRGVPTQ